MVTVALSYNGALKAGMVETTTRCHFYRASFYEELGVSNKALCSLIWTYWRWVLLMVYLIETCDA